MRKWYLEEVEPAPGPCIKDIDRAHGVTYWKLVTPNSSEGAWRICICRNVNGEWQLWSRGEPKITDPRFEDIHLHALAFGQLAGDCEGFPEQEFDL